MSKELKEFHLEDGSYETTLNKKFENRKVWQNPVAGEIKSNLPGTILDIHVQVGQEVKRGDLLLIHEAMKMKNRILAPMDGQVASISVEVGERIKKDALMLTITPKA